LFYRKFQGISNKAAKILHIQEEIVMIDSGDTGFMLICSALVLFMTPGLAFFYGGLVRRKNVLSTMMNTFFIMGLAGAMWVLVGYSLSFSGNTAGIIGNLNWACFNNVTGEPGPYADTIPHLVFAAFQMMFAMITPALITGSVAGRMNFKALFAFMVLWLLVIYYPLAHMVWGQGGFLGEVLGSVDFAGGNVVHISSGVSGLVLCLMLGKRKG
jgi:Amt family ammonium transporter